MLPCLNRPKRFAKAQDSLELETPEGHGTLKNRTSQCTGLNDYNLFYWEYNFSHAHIYEHIRVSLFIFLYLKAYRQLNSRGSFSWRGLEEPMNN